MKPENLTDVDTKSNSVENDQIAHLAGVFDAVGNISLQVVKDSNYRLDYTIRPKLQIQRYDENDPVLGKLAAYCEEEGVRYSVTESSNSESVKMVVKDPDSIKRFLEPMMDYLVTDYFRAELMLGEVLPAMEDEQHLSEEGFYQLMGIADKMREGKSLRTEPKYTQEYFEELWSLSE